MDWLLSEWEDGFIDMFETFCNSDEGGTGKARLFQVLCKLKI